MQTPDQFTLVANFLRWCATPGPFTTLMPIITYRGHASRSFKLLPTLGRDTPSARGDLLKQWEEEVIDAFRREFGHLRKRSDLEVLAFARHHGAPTRLLDWTSNPLIALWFAVSDSAWDQEDGKVFQLDASRSFHKSLCICSVDAFDATESEEIESHLILCPPGVDRGRRQESVLVIPRFKSGPFTPLDEIRAIEIRELEIPSRLKARLRSLLLDVGLNPHSIYGGPDALGKHLSHRFSSQNVIDSI